MSESNMGNQIPHGDQSILGKLPVEVENGVIPQRDLQAKVYIFAVVVMILAILGVFITIRFVKWVDQTNIRVDVLEMKNKIDQFQNRISELEKVKTVQEQAFGNLTQSHNGLIKATEGIANQFNARIEALEKKASEETAKVEAAKVEAAKDKGWFGNKESKKK